MVTMMLLTMRQSIMAAFTLPLSLQIMGWIATVAMAATVVAMVASWLPPISHTAISAHQTYFWLADLCVEPPRLAEQQVRSRGI
jgi:hypothetical protein